MSSKAKPDVICKSNDGPFEIKLLDEQGREDTLLQLQEFVEGDFLADCEKWYKVEDWNYVKPRLDKLTNSPQ